MLRTRDKAQLQEQVWPRRSGLLLPAAALPVRQPVLPQQSSRLQLAVPLSSPHPHLVPEDSDAYKIHLQTKFQGQISAFPGQKSEPFKIGRPPPLLLF